MEWCLYFAKWNKDGRETTAWKRRALSPSWGWSMASRLSMNGGEKTFSLFWPILGPETGPPIGTRRLSGTPRAPGPPTGILCCSGGVSVGFLLLLHVQEDDAEQEQAHHHREGAGVVRKGGRDETLVLRMLQRADGHLVRRGTRH